MPTLLLLGNSNSLSLHTLIQAICLSTNSGQLKILIKFMSNSISLSMFLRDYFVHEWSSGVVQTFLSHVTILNWLNRSNISLCLWQGGLIIDNKHSCVMKKSPPVLKTGPQLSGVTDTVSMASYSCNLLVSSRPVETWPHQDTISSMIDWSCAINIHLKKFGGSYNIQLKLGRSDCIHMISHSEIFSLYCGRLWLQTRGFCAESPTETP